MPDNSVPTLARQSGLMEAAQMIANNIANSSTPGYKAESTIFAEYVSAGRSTLGSLSMGHLKAHATDTSGGALERTGGSLDFAIDGAGFFKIDTVQGERLSRAGIFQIDVDGNLIDMMGGQVLDSGGGQIAIPQEATQISVAKDGTISADGVIVAQIGVYQPNGELERAGNNYWFAREGDQVLETPSVLQGFVEQSNVSPVQEFAKLMLTQRMFEAGQTMMEQEHDRLSSVIEAIRQQG